ncbi:very short patch repair endonuclease [Niabella drilacis]|uniref:Very short patch repair endonuclease n=1 Tax=Niabella drilacis (strain DSM 25811 / CCM 8410 / CCUG 62505 / LMG 26954 / E90) TaxID=1285928 RepID=A0A1G6JB39_NIADE|nr:very short patch repair endonuclease [Niabella drilacis]SDC16112.1 T/G mismatch-specific endonuclease [Niabella drilacis]
MADIWSKEKRSEVMSKIRSKDTKPEIMLRKALFALGYRYRIHNNKLPGKPDIVLPKYKTAIFVHGCFWHYHADCREGRIPNTNSTFWKEKLLKNISRDQKHQETLAQLGWEVLVCWECEIEKDLEAVIKGIVRAFL